MKLLKFFQTHRPLTFAILIVLIILVASGLFFATRKSATLEILVAPTSARIVINDKDYQNGTYKLEPGNMVATISKAGFTTKTVNFVLNEHQVTKLYVYLLEEGGGYDWYLEHAEDAKILSKIGDTEADYKSEHRSGNHGRIFRNPFENFIHSSKILFLLFHLKVYRRF